MEREAQASEAADYVACQERRRQSIIDQWRDLPTIPSRRTFEEELGPRPYISALSPPDALDEVAEEKKLRRELLAAMRPLPIRAKLVMFAVAAIAAVVARPMVPGVGGSIIVAGATMIAAALLLFELRARKLAGAQRGAAWEERRRVLVEAHRAALEEHREAEAAAERAWQRADAARIEELEALLAGEREVSEVAVADELGLLDFPFETDCRFEIPAPTLVRLAVDLPEIEDVIPDTAERALKDGRVKTVNRTRKDQQRDYAALVTGLGLQLAAAVLAASPIFDRVVIAAYTQRRESKTGLLQDEWVYELELERGVMVALNPATADPIAVATKAPGRIDLRPNFDLRSIRAPSWWGDEGAEA